MHIHTVTQKFTRPTKTGTGEHKNKMITSELNRWDSGKGGMLEEKGKPNEREMK